VEAELCGLRKIWEVMNKDGLCADEDANKCGPAHACRWAERDVADAVARDLNREFPTELWRVVRVTY
jgi:hypothetical protein